MTPKNIRKTKKGYNIQKTIYGQKIDYGTYPTLQEAQKQITLLKKHNWIKNKSLGYTDEEIFIKYTIRQDDEGNYIIINKKGKTYGSYKSKKFAKIVKHILAFHQDIDINEIEEKAIKEFYKYIRYNKLLGKYQVIYNARVVLTTNTLLEALEERDLYVKYDADEELMCENIDTIYKYTEGELPPIP